MADRWQPTLRSALLGCIVLALTLAGCCRNYNQPQPGVMTAPPAGQNNPFLGRPSGSIFQDTTVPPPEASMFAPPDGQGFPPATGLGGSPTGTPRATTEPAPRTTTRTDPNVRPSSATLDDGAWRASGGESADLEPVNRTASANSGSEPPLRIVAPSDGPGSRTLDGAPANWQQPHGPAAGQYPSSGGQ